MRCANGRTQPPVRYSSVLFDRGPAGSMALNRASARPTQEAVR
jgi:hypothetical protein